MKRLGVFFVLAAVGCGHVAAITPHTAQQPVVHAQMAAAVEDLPQAPAVGSLEIKTNAGEPQTVRLESIEVRAKTQGDFVEAEIDHVFESKVESRSEGTFRFPLPDGAILLGLAMEIEGKLVKGEIVEREKAQKVFEQIEDQMRDPALLEWDQGNVFKLRVFPVDPGEHKRIVLRYAAPLKKNGFAYPIAPVQGTIGHAKVTLDGKTLLDEKDISVRKDVNEPIASVPTVVEQVNNVDHFLAVHAAPDWSKIAAPTPSGPKRVIVVADTSRSMLEERKLALSSIRKVLEALGDADSFRLVTSDLEAHALTTMSAKNKANIDAALAKLDAIEPDGASDIGAMVRAVAKMAKDDKATMVIYVGDGSATWGESKSSELASAAKQSIGLPVHAMLLGDRADLDSMQTIAAATGAMMDHPRTEPEAERFAKRVVRSPELKRLEDAHVTTSEGEILPAQSRTLYEGEEIVALVKAPKTPSLALEGTGYKSPVLAMPQAAKLVQERFAKARITELEGASGDHKDEIVKLSLDNGVLSKHTSLLVLESDEAYERFKIERRNAKNENVSGNDLESAASRVARLDPDHLQPGDPEVRIDAPSSARKVTVLFPFGETKEATWDSNVHAWTVRFLVDRDTPDGTYEVMVTIVHADGSIETQHLHYVVDTQHPEVDVTMRPARGRPGTFEIRASQVITEREINAAIPADRRTGTLDEQRAKFKNELEDARKVDVRMPDGTVITLTALAIGEFRGYWTPSSPVTGPITLHVVAFDRARNQGEKDVVVRAELVEARWKGVRP